MTRIKAALDWILPMLREKQIPFHVTGGFAAHLFGATRPVNDIDIDLPSHAIEAFGEAVGSFVESPPQRYEDATWKMFGVTLNFEGQLIDLTTDDEPRVHNKTTGNWDPLEMRFDDVVWIHAYGHDIPVQNPRDLMSYKLKIRYDEEKHLSDAAAVAEYIARHARS